MASERDINFLKMAVEEGKKCKPSHSAYSVGAVVVTVAGDVFCGHTHETNGLNHAEEEAILKAEKSGVDLTGARIYTTMEPCTNRRSKELSCSQLIIEKGFGSVVYVIDEPDHFTVCNGKELLENAGLEVIKIADFEKEIIDNNCHILK